MRISITALIFVACIGFLSTSDLYFKYGNAVYIPGKKIKPELIEITNAYVKYETTTHKGTTSYFPVIYTNWQKLKVVCTGIGNLCQKDNKPKDFFIHKAQYYPLHGQYIALNKMIYSYSETDTPISFTNSYNNNYSVIDEINSKISNGRLISYFMITLALVCMYIAPKIKKSKNHQNN